MAVPSHMSDSTFEYVSMALVTDVADIITQLRASLTGATPAWTEPVSGTFRSPVESGTGRYVEFDISAASTTRLDIDARDMFGRDLWGGAGPRKMDIVAAGDRVQIFFGSHYVWVETQNPSGVLAEAEHFAVGMLDLFPEANDAHTQWAWARTRRSSAGTADANGDTWGEAYAIDNGSGASRQRFVRLATHQADPLTRRPSGAYVYAPVETSILDSGNNPRSAGRLYQAVVCDDALEPWAELTLPISASPVTTGVFKVSNCRELNSQRIAWRIG